MATRQVTINKINDLSEEEEIIDPSLLEMFESYHNNKGATNER